MLDFKVKLHKFHLGWVSASDFAYKVFELSEGCGSNLYNCFLNPLMPMTHSQISESKVDSENRRRNRRRLLCCLSCEFGSEIGTKSRLQKSVPITALLYSKPKSACT